jgi:protein-S-isoprenylcysteine O-methyltransferase Ste14
MEHLRLLTITNALFYIFNLLWILEFLIFRNRQKIGRFKENKSFWFLSLSILMVIVLTIYFSRMGWGIIKDHAFFVYVQILALLLYAFGLWLRYRGSQLLGHHFTRHVAVSSSINLVSTGPYRYLRHPLYLGLFIITIAFPIYVGNLYALFIGLPLLTFVFAWRMRIEEKALRLVHPSYASWAKSRYRFIPFIY